MSRDARTSGYVFPMPGSALLQAWREGYTLDRLKRDVLAGLTIGVVAVPLSMALAVATGVPPQHGLYTAIVAGAIIALTGGSRFNISGPTAAFVVILFPIVAHHGLGGLLIATFMAGVILVALGLSRLGSLIQYVPYPVILGFTAGIGVVIALLQLPDFLGLSGITLGDSTLHNLLLIGQALPSLSLEELSVGMVTLAVLLIWPRLHTPLPAPLAGLAIGTLAATLLLWGGIEVDTIASRFSWELGGEHGNGIPPFAPGLIAPWHFPGADGQPLVIDFALIQALLGPALAIALLAAIESLLCAVVADGLTRTRHDPNAELIGQGLGNMVVPFFGGITATAALARTATNVKSGAFSPIAAVVHSLVVLLAVVALAGLLGFVPMASLAALLFIIAWNMSEARHAEKRPRQRCGGAAHLLRADGDFRYGHRGGRRYRAGSRPVHPPNGSTDSYSAPGLSLYRRALSTRGRALQDERPAVFWRRRKGHRHATHRGLRRSYGRARHARGAQPGHHRHRGTGVAAPRAGRARRRDHLRGATATPGVETEARRHQA